MNGDDGLLLAHEVCTGRFCDCDCRTCLDAQTPVPTPFVAPRASQGAATGNEYGTDGIVLTFPTAGYHAMAVSPGWTVRHSGAASATVKLTPAAGWAHVNAASPSPALVERVARAIADTNDDGIFDEIDEDSPDGPYDDHDDALMYHRFARAALAALAPEAKP